MLWIIILCLTFFSAALVYSFRYISRRRVGGLYIIQFYYLFIVAPIAFVSLINIGLDIIFRPVFGIIPISTEVFFSLYAFSLAIAITGNGIHSTSTSIAQAFPKGSYTKAYITNEAIHGPLSHDMLYLGGIATTVFLALLEINHPDVANLMSLHIPIIFGVIIGILEAASVIWSTHIGINLGASFIGILILVAASLSLNLGLSYYPIAVTAFTSLLTLFILLFLFSLIVVTSKRLTASIVKIVFPPGHALHQSFNLL